ncbi:putative polygalacturonase [Rosa sericea]
MGKAITQTQVDSFLGRRYRPAMLNPLKGSCQKYFWAQTLSSVSCMVFVIVFSSILGIGFGQATNYSVLEFGAHGDGSADDSQAFLAAFQKACGTPGAIQTVNVPPEKPYLLKPLILTGPCKAKNIRIQVDGAAPANINEWRGCELEGLLCFQEVNGLIINGAGLVDGKGSTWWSSKSNLIDTTDGNNGCQAPALLHFHKCNNLNLNGVRSKGSPGIHAVIH